MNWNIYKNKVKDSRDQIVVPLLIDNISGIEAGIGLDVGCGDGDLTNEIISKSKIQFLGIDIDEKLIKIARERNINGYFSVGDLSKRAISKTGMMFNVCFSNCFFNHLDNHSTIACLDDLYSSMSINSKVIILVPHWRRANEKYVGAKNYPWGITAVPEYGNLQYFRYGEWYCKALNGSGFNILKHETIVIPDSLHDSERYGRDVGMPIFTLIVANVVANKESLDLTRKAFDIAHDNRNFEIDMLWKRSLYYWGFIAASFVGYVASEKVNSNLSIVFCAFGFMCAVAWSAGNRGSKYWQEYWENKVVLFQNRVTGDIFIDHFPRRPSIFSQFSARRLSVSKLIIGISDFTILIWLSLLLCKTARYFGVYNGPFPGYIYACGIVLTVLYSIYLICSCKSED
jgi:SAM-dependent methyltransferase